MTIETKFNIGDKVFTIDTKTTKVKGFEVESIIAFAGNGYTRVTYKEKGSSVLESNYEEEKCFATPEELIDYVMKSE